MNQDSGSVENLKTKVSVVIPCFNSPQSLRQLVYELLNFGQDFLSFEIILVCDDEKNSTWQLVKSLARDGEVRAFWLGKNLGQHRATLLGAQIASSEIIFTIDDDGQYPVAALPEMLSKIYYGADLVYGSPRAGKHGKLRNALSKNFKYVASRTSLIMNAEKISSQRAFKKELISNVDSNLPKGFNLDALLLSRTNRVFAIKVDIVERSVGASNYSFRSLIRHTANLLFTRVDTLSIFMFCLGVFGMFVSIVVSLIIAMGYILGLITVQGYSSIMLLLSFGFSITLILQGLTGRMLSLLLNQLTGYQGSWIREEVGTSKNRVFTK